MASQAYQPHFVLIPYMQQGHLVPMIDIAKLLAQRNVYVSIVTTPHNAARFRDSIDYSNKTGLHIRVLEIKFPSTEAGLPEGCESVDTLPSKDLFKNFNTASSMLQEPVEKLFAELNPKPSCMVSDRNFAWTADIAAKFRVPRILFDGLNTLSLLCFHNLGESKIHENVPESEPFLVPGLPDRIEIASNQLPGHFNPRLDKEFKKLATFDESAYGVLVNSFEELEPEYVVGYRNATGNEVWCVGPVSLCNEEISDKAQRGNKASIDVNQYLKWLDSWPPNSVIYACLGSCNRFTLPQLRELGQGLEATNRPFIWVMRSGDFKREEVEKWLEEDGFEKRVKDRGFVIRGWAPQVLILSHPAIAAFLTHCGWNSTLEGICAGVPMITWPVFAEQFINEKLIVQVKKIGLPVGNKVMVPFGEEEKFGVLVKSQQVKDAIEKVMNCEEIKKEARKLAEMAKAAVAEGGSSYHNITLLIEDIIQQVKEKLDT